MDLVQARILYSGVWGLIIWAPSIRPSVSTSVRRSVDSDFSEVYGSNSLKLYTKIRYGLRIMHVKYIFDIIQNGGLAAILNVNTLGAVTRTTATGFLSNLVQRESLGGPTCMPIYFLFDLKSGGHICFLTPMITLLAYISKIVQDRGLVTIIHI